MRKSATFGLPRELVDNFRNRYWKPAQIAAGSVPLRRVQDLRYTFATAVGVALFSTEDVVTIASDGVSASVGRPLP